MTARACLALDPGSTYCGWALVEWTPSETEPWSFTLRMGAHDDNMGRVAAQIERAAILKRIVALEEVTGQVYSGRSASALFESCKMEGQLVGAALLHGATLQRIPARDWRGDLCRSPGASDAQVRLVVEGLCPIRPTLNARAREHVYDAAGLAIVALAREMKRPIRLPSWLSGELHMLQATEKVARAEKKATKEKRSQTRAQRARRSAAATKAWEARRS